MEVVLLFVCHIRRTGVDVKGCWPVRLFSVIASTPCFVHTLECELFHGVSWQEPWVVVSGYGT